MMKLSASVLFACVCAGLLLACSPEAHSEGATRMASVAVDIDKLGQFLADDWVSRRRDF
jgi:hypothetical protein